MEPKELNTNKGTTVLVHAQPGDVKPLDLAIISTIGVVGYVMAVSDEPHGFHRVRMQFMGGTFAADLVYKLVEQPESFDPTKLLFKQSELKSMHLDQLRRLALAWGIDAEKHNYVEWQNMIFTAQEAHVSGQRDARIRAEQEEAEKARREAAQAIVIDALAKMSEECEYNPQKIGIEVLRALGYKVDVYPGYGVPISVYVQDKNGRIIYSTD